MVVAHTFAKAWTFAGHLKQPSPRLAGELCFHQARHLCKEKNWLVGVLVLAHWG